MPYRMYRVFCATPGDLEDERQAFHKALSDVNATEAMPRGILLVSVSILPHMSNKLAYQAVVDENVRACTFYIQVLHETWGPSFRNFEREYKLAHKLRAEGGDMKDLAVFFKAAGDREIEPAVSKFRAALAANGGPPALEFAEPSEFQDQLRAQLSAWLKTLPD